MPGTSVPGYRVILFDVFFALLLQCHEECNLIGRYGLTTDICRNDEYEKF